MNTAKRKVVILGAGYAGVMSASRLAGSVKPRWTWSIRSRNSLRGFAWHEVAARQGSESATPWSTARLVHPEVHMRLGTLTRMRPDDQEMDYGVAGPLR